MPAPEYCTLEQAWGKDYNPNYATDGNNNISSMNNGQNNINNQNNKNNQHQLFHPSHLKNRQSNRPSQNQNQNQNQKHHSLFESATGNYFKDIKETDPYKEADYKSICQRHNNPLFPDENHQRLIEPHSRNYFSRTMAPLKDTQGSSNRYFSNPLIQNLRREQANKTNKKLNNKPIGLYEDGTGGYFPIKELGNESNYFTNAMKNMISENNNKNTDKNTDKNINNINPYNSNNNAFMTINQRAANNEAALNNTQQKQNNNVNNSNNANITEKFSNNEKFSNMETYINYLEENNDLLRQQISLLQKNTEKESPSAKMYVFDLLLYIISGIFIIYILDLFVKVLLKNKSK